MIKQPVLAAVRSAMGSAPFGAVVLVGLAAAPAYAAEPRILWPEEGHFLAYPSLVDADRVRVTASAGYAEDDNLFRLADSEDPALLLGSDQRDDAIRRLGAGVRVNVPVSRQRLTLDVTADDYAYDEFDYLDHTAYQGRAGWRWVIGNSLEGDLGVERGRSLASFGELQSSGFDLVTRERAVASIAYRMGSRWRIRAAGQWAEFQHSNPELFDRENEVTRAIVGFDYVSPAGGAIGIQAVREHGEYPNREIIGTALIDNAYDEDSIDAVVEWPFGGTSSLELRAGYTKREHEDVTERDFDGVTGRAKLALNPGAKTQLVFEAYRELQNVEDLQASYVLTDGASFGPAWAPTEKIIVQLSYVYEKRQYEGDPGLVLGLTPPREDELSTARIILGYQPTRMVRLYGTYQTGDRDSNIENVTYDYEVMSVNLAVSFGR